MCKYMHTLGKMETNFNIKKKTVACGLMEQGWEEWNQDWEFWVLKKKILSSNISPLLPPSVLGRESERNTHTPLSTEDHYSFWPKHCLLWVWVSSCPFCIILFLLHQHDQMMKAKEVEDVGVSVGVHMHTPSSLLSFHAGGDNSLPINYITPSVNMYKW